MRGYTNIADENQAGSPENRVEPGAGESGEISRIHLGDSTPNEPGQNRQQPSDKKNLNRAGFLGADQICATEKDGHYGSGRGSRQLGKVEVKIRAQSYESKGDFKGKRQPRSDAPDGTNKGPHAPVKKK